MLDMHCQNQFKLFWKSDSMHMRLQFLSRHKLSEFQNLIKTDSQQRNYPKQRNYPNISCCQASMTVNLCINQTSGIVSNDWQNHKPKYVHVVCDLRSWIIDPLWGMVQGREPFPKTTLPFLSDSFSFNTCSNLTKEWTIRTVADIKVWLVEYEHNSTRILSLWEPVREGNTVVVLVPDVSNKF